jgi:hypothetical protein
MTRRVWVRGPALAVVALAVVAALTVYYSSESVPPCLVSGVPMWRPPTDGATHRFMVVFPDRAACFFDLDDQNKLVGALRLPEARGISVAAPLLDDVALRTTSGPMTLDLRTGKLRRGGVVPWPSPILTSMDREHEAMYVTQRGLLGFRVIDLRNGLTRFVMHFKGFSWNPRFGPNPPSHGLSLAPDRPELWVLDSPNSSLHVFDVSALPDQPPRRVADVRLSKTMNGIGSLVRSADGRFLYVGDDGDVVDTRTRDTVETLEALQKSRVALEVDWVAGRPSFPR